MTVPERPRFRVAIADDDRVVLDALAMLVGRRADYEVVATCTDGEELVAATSRLHPDAVVTDVTMPGGDAPMVAALAGLDARPLIVAMSGRISPAVVGRLRAAGADAVLRKGLEDPIAVLERLRRP